MELPLPRNERKTSNLHIGRFSYANTRHFVTFVTDRRKPWLASGPQQAVALQALRDWHARQDGRILAATIMPDHVHVLFESGAKFTVGQTVGSWKTTIRKSITYADSFQRDFWEHRLRHGEPIEDYALYILLNPYRAGLIGAAKLWPGWWVPEPTRFRFSEYLSNGLPPPEWLGWPDERFAELRVGE